MLWSTHLKAGSCGSCVRLVATPMADVFFPRAETA